MMSLLSDRGVQDFKDTSHGRLSSQLNFMPTTALMTESHMIRTLTHHTRGQEPDVGSQHK